MKFNQRMQRAAVRNAEIENELMLAQAKEHRARARMLKADAIAQEIDNSASNQGGTEWPRDEDLFGNNSLSDRQKRALKAFARDGFR